MAIGDAQTFAVPADAKVQVVDAQGPVVVGASLEVVVGAQLLDRSANVQAQCRFRQTVKAAVSHSLKHSLVLS